MILTDAVIATAHDGAFSVTRDAAIAIAGEMIGQGQIDVSGQGPYRHVRMHAIEADRWLSDLSLRTKFNTEWSFLNDLKTRGRAAADEWLESCLGAVGRHASVDMQARFG